jgi:leucyl-tRNA synthetase
MELADRNKIAYWMPVDLYVGGAEHAVLHLLYARFWHKVLYELGIVNTSEPFMRLINQGLILGEDGQKMSKSLGNVINPDDIIRDYGADSMRVYEMFMGPLQVTKPWSTNGLVGVHRFLDRIWRLSERPLTDEPLSRDMERLLHKSIKKVSQDTENLEFNTAISQMMILVNELFKLETLPRKAWEAFVLLLAPYAPHLAEELWEKLGHTPSVSRVPFPEWNEELARDDEVTIVIQVNGKMRAKVQALADLSEQDLKDLALNQKRIQELVNGKTPKKIITVPNKLVNIVL